MIVNTQQLLFDLVLFIYGLVAMLFAIKIIWLTKKKINEAFQFLLVAILAWVIVKLLAILNDLRVLSVYAVRIGELFFITLLIICTWYINHTLLNYKKKR